MLPAMCKASQWGQACVSEWHGIGEERGAQCDVPMRSSQKVATARPGEVDVKASLQCGTEGLAPATLIPVCSRVN